MVCWCMLIKLHLCGWSHNTRQMNEGRQSSCSHSLDWDTTPMYWRVIRFYPITAHLTTQLSVCCVESFGYVMCDFMGVCNNVFYWQFAKVCAWRAHEVMMRWRGRCLPLVSRALLFCPNSPVPLAEQPWHTHTHNQSFLPIQKHAFTISSRVKGRH